MRNAGVKLPFYWKDYKNFLLDEVPENFKEEVQELKERASFLAVQQAQFDAFYTNYKEIGLYKTYEGETARASESNPILKFDHEGRLLLNHSFENNPDFKELQEAYRALGGVLGQFFKHFKLPVGHYGLDPHDNNIFFDKDKKVVTWIDLQN